MLLMAKFVIFLCSVISQGKAVPLDRWSGKWRIDWLLNVTIFYTITFTIIIRLQ